MRGPELCPDSDWSLSWNNKLEILKIPLEVCQFADYLPRYVIEQYCVWPASCDYGGLPGDHINTKIT